MGEKLSIGNTIYHHTNRTEAWIRDVKESTITIELSKELSNKKILILPKTHVGEWLFFSLSDFDLELSELIKRPEYVSCGNKKIIEALEKSKKEQDESIVRKRKDFHENRVKQVAERKAQELTRRNKAKVVSEVNKKKETNRIISAVSVKKEKSVPVIKLKNMSQKVDESMLIREIIEKRKIEYLLHFTRIENLHSILTHGLIPVSLHSELSIDSLRNDDYRIDSMLECTSCSIGFPNYKLLYTFRENKFPNSRWVMIAIDPEVLISKINKAYFCQTNAARVLPRTLFIDELTKASSFENMFCDNIITKHNITIFRKDLEIFDFFTTDPQAEVLISSVISKKYFICICFQNEADRDYYFRLNGSSLLSEIDVQIVPGFFGPRKDYTVW